MGIDLEKQQSTVAKGDASAEPNKEDTSLKRQDDTQKKSTGKMLEEKHSPSDEALPENLALYVIAGGFCGSVVASWMMDRSRLGGIVEMFLVIGGGLIGVGCALCRFAVFRESLLYIVSCFWGVLRHNMLKLLHFFRIFPARNDPIYGGPSHQTAKSHKIDDHGGIFLGFLVGIMALVGGIFFICNASYTFGGFLLLIGGGSIGLCVYLLLQVSKGSSLFSEEPSYEPGSCGSEESDKNALQDVGTDLEKQQSTLAKDDTWAEPNKDVALPKRQDDAQEKGTGKMLEEKHSPSDKVDHKYALLGNILMWIGGGVLFFSIFVLGCDEQGCSHPDGWKGMVIGGVLSVLGGFLNGSFDADD